MNNSEITFSGVKFLYDKNEVLHGVGAEVEKGKITAVFGPNGSGKTTLLKCLACLSVPKEGRIIICGQDTRGLNKRQISRLISYVPQEHAVSFGFTVEEVVLMGRTPHLGGIQGPSNEDYEAVRKAIHTVGIQDIGTNAYTALSGGQRQLVLIARALAQECPIMIMDEPTAALDFRNQLVLWKQLSSLRQAGKTILVCTHDPNHVKWFCDRMIVVNQGKVFASGEVGELLTEQLMEQLYGITCRVENGSVIPLIKK